MNDNRPKRLPLARVRIGPMDSLVIHAEPDLALVEIHYWGEVLNLTPERAGEIGQALVRAAGVARGKP